MSGDKENDKARLLSVVFSFRNEEVGLDELIVRVRSVLASQNIAYELIFVNDDSTDRSLEILKGYHESDKRIKIVNMSRRFGFYPCILAGIAHSQGDAVVYMATDLQDPPELIPEMVAKFIAGADVVNTIRTKRHGESAFKMWATKKAYRIINLLADIDLPENMGDFKLLSRRVAKELLSLREYDPYLRGIVRWLGFRQETVYYERPARFSGKTHFPLFGKAPAQEFIRGITSFSAVPLYIALLYGFIVSLLSFLYLIFVIVTKFLGVNLPGWSALMAVTLFIGGNMLLTNGFLGLYIGRIYSQVKNRPSYLIDNTIGFDKD